MTDGNETAEEDSTARRQLNSATAALRGYRLEKTRGDLLDGAIADFETLVESLPEMDPVRLAALTNLSAALHDRFNLSLGDRSILNRAIGLAQESTDLTGTNDYWYSSRVNNLGALIRERYQLNGVVDDLRKIVADQERLLDDDLAPSRQQAMISSNVGQGLRELYEITLDRRYLRRAYIRHRHAVRLARAYDDPALPMILHHAGITTRTWRPSETGCRAAIALQSEAIRLTEPSSVDLPARRTSLALTFLSLSRTTKGAEALSAVGIAVSEFTDVIAHVDERSPHASIPLLGLAEAVERRHELTAPTTTSSEPDRTAHAQTLAAYDRALTAQEVSSPISALASAWYGARSAIRAADDETSLRFLHRGLRATAQLLPRQMQRDDQRSWQLHSERLGPAAAVLHVRHRDPIAAVEVLDSSRARESWMLARAAGVTGHPIVVRSWLDSGGPGGNATIDAALREAPDGRRPLRRLTTPSTARHAVAYLIPSEMGGAVIVLRSDGSVGSTLLARLTTSAVMSRRRQLARAYANRGTDPEQFEDALANIGRWLGNGVIRTMLQLHVGTEPLVVVPCGALADLPLMTAWQPEPAGGKRYPLLERGVVFAFGARPPVVTFRTGVANRILVIQDRPSSIRPFEGVIGELLECPGSTDTLHAPDPAELTNALGRYDLVHISCHGNASRTDSADSSIHLSETVDLRVCDILQARLHSWQVVFLSSCETGAADPKLPDQTFGPPTAFLRAGAGTVVAPLLAVRIATSTLLAARFYGEMAVDQTPHQALARAQRWIADSTADQRLDFLTDCARELEGTGRPTHTTRRLIRALARSAARDPGAKAPLSDWCLFTAQI